MVFKDDQEAIDFIKRHSTHSKWIALARENHKVLKALVIGKGFNDVLIEKIEKIESVDRAASRKKHSKDIRDMFPDIGRIEARSDFLEYYMRLMEDMLAILIIGGSDPTLPAVDLSSEVQEEENPQVGTIRRL